MTGTPNLLADHVAASDLLGYVEAGVAMPGPDRRGPAGGPGCRTRRRRRSGCATGVPRRPLRARLGERADRRRPAGVAAVSDGPCSSSRPAAGASGFPARTCGRWPGSRSWVGPHGSRAGRGRSRAGRTVSSARTDDPAIAAAAWAWGARRARTARPSWRRTARRRSTSPSTPSRRSAAPGAGSARLVLVQPTSPLTESGRPRRRRSNGSTRGGPAS